MAKNIAYTIINTFSGRHNVTEIFGNTVSSQIANQKLILSRKSTTSIGVVFTKTAVLSWASDVAGNIIAETIFLAII